jgi:hypothetical protein
MLMDVFLVIYIYMNYFFSQLSQLGEGKQCHQPRQGVREGRGSNSLMELSPS